MRMSDEELVNEAERNLEAFQATSLNVEFVMKYGSDRAIRVLRKILERYKRRWIKVYG